MPTVITSAKKDGTYFAVGTCITIHYIMQLF